MWHSWGWSIREVWPIVISLTCFYIKLLLTRCSWHFQLVTLKGRLCGVYVDVQLMFMVNLVTQSKKTATLAKKPVFYLTAVMSLVFRSHPMDAGIYISALPAQLHELDLCVSLPDFPPCSSSLNPSDLIRTSLSLGISTLRISAPKKYF